MKKIYVTLSALLVIGFAAQAQDGMGIGNNNPQEMLDVSGAIKIGTTTNSNAGAIRWNGSNFQGYDGTQWVDFDDQGTDDQTAAEVDVTANADLIATDVQEALEELQSEILGTQPTISEVLGYGDDANTGQQLNIEKIAALNSDGLLLTDDGNNGIIIEDGGNVGIGVNTPSNPLHVKSQVGGEVTVGLFENFIPNSSIGSSAGIKITGRRGQATNDVAFIDFENNSSGNVLSRIHVRSDDILRFSLNDGGTLTQRMTLDNTGLLEINTIKVTGGNPGSGKVLTSDADGDATWTDLVPSGAVMYFDLPGCPTGWSEFTAGRGRYIVGTPNGGTDGATVGTALSNQENRATGAHAHSIDPPNTSTSTDGAHNHDFYTANNDVNDTQSQGYPANNNHSAFRTTDRRQRTEDNGTIQTAGSHSHTVDIPAFNSASTGSVAGTNAPYVQLKVCRKD